MRARAEEWIEYLRRKGVVFFPRLERAERLALVESLGEASHWSANFGMMLGCSVIIAGLGLIQGSVAVIIGAMLVAPLMTPLIAMGLAMVQGNFKLLQRAGRAMLWGTGISVLLGLILALVIPGDELTLEVIARGAPNVLDLGIAFFAGVAAGYAIAKPKLSGALPGVAISVALVPPLAASGIALGSGDWLISLGALLLFATNLVAISLGSALVFRLHGISTPESSRGTGLTVKRIMLAMGIVLVLLSAPLAYRLADQLRAGQAKPESFTLSEEMWFRLHDRLDREEGVDFISGVRASSERPEDVVIVLSADRPVPGVLINELDEMVDRGIGSDLKVKFNVIQQGLVTGLDDALKETEKSEPVVNE